MEEVHEWEFLQTLWEVDRNTSTSTWGNSREYAYLATLKSKTGGK